MGPEVPTNSRGTFTTYHGAEESASGKSGVVSYASTVGTPTSRPVKDGVSCLSSVETVSLSVGRVPVPVCRQHLS